MEHLTVPEERVGLELDEFLCLAFPHVNKGFLRAQVGPSFFVVHTLIAPLIWVGRKHSRRILEF